MSRQQWTRLRILSATLAGLVAILWIRTLMAGVGDTVILVMPYEIVGRLGPAGDTPISAAVETVRAINQHSDSLSLPAFELRIGPTALDRSLESTEQIRWLPSAPEVGLRAEPAWWFATSPSPSATEVLPQMWLKRAYWTLLGRKTRVYSGQILAASGRLMVQTSINGRSLNAEMMNGNDWQVALYQINEALFYDHAPIASAISYLRLHRYESAESIVEGLLSDRDPGNDLYATCLGVAARQAREGLPPVPWRAYEEAWTGHHLLVPRWHAALIDWWPGRARQRRFAAGALQLAAGQALEAEAWSMAEGMAEVAQAHRPGDPGAQLLLAYAAFRQRDLRVTVDITNRLAVRWPATQPNHPALLLHKTLQALQYPEASLREVEALAFPSVPADPILLNNRAVWHYFRRQFDSAEINLDTALETRPWRVVAVENAAVLSGRSDDLLVASQQFRRARFRTAHLPSTWLHPARFLFDRGDYGLAADLLAEGRTRLPRTYEIALQGAYARAAQGSQQEDEELLAIVAQGLDDLGRDPLIPRERWALYRGHVAYFAGDYRRAEAAYQEAVEAQESSGIAMYGLGQVAFLEHRWAEAAEHFDAFLQFQPAHTRARLFYVLALQQLDDPRARTMLEGAAVAENRPWMHRLIQHYLGEATTAEVRATAYEPGITSTEQLRRECTVEFHLGMHLLQTQGPASVAGRDALRRSVATRLAHHYEYQAAMAALADG